MLVSARNVQWQCASRLHNIHELFRFFSYFSWFLISYIHSLCASVLSGRRFERCHPGMSGSTVQVISFACISLHDNPFSSKSTADSASVTFFRVVPHFRSIEFASTNKVKNILRISHLGINLNRFKFIKTVVVSADLISESVRECSFFFLFASTKTILRRRRRGKQEGKKIIEKVKSHAYVSQCGSITRTHRI